MFAEGDDADARERDRHAGPGPRPHALPQQLGGKQRGKRALLSRTTGADEASYRKGARNGDIHAMLRSVQRGVLAYAGFDVLTPHIVWTPEDMSAEQRAAALATWAARLEQIADEPPIDVGEH